MNLELRTSDKEPCRFACTLTLRNRQRTRAVNLPLLRRMIQTLLWELLDQQSFDLGFYLVGAREMIHLNEAFLRHKGSTDVITFDYSDTARPELLSGEIFVCVDEAGVQARRFHTTWQSELVRYVVHGVLHLSGYDDRKAPMRRKMKRAEDRLLQQLASRYNLSRLGGPRSR